MAAPVPAPPPATAAAPGRMLLFVFLIAVAAFMLGFTAGTSSRLSRGDDSQRQVIRLRMPASAAAAAAVDDADAASGTIDAATGAGWGRASSPAPAPAPASPSAPAAAAASASASLATTGSPSRAATPSASAPVPSRAAAAPAAAAAAPADVPAPAAAGGGRRLHCGGIAPLPGTYNNVTPPYFFPDPAVCPTPPVFTPTDFLRCMAARKGRVFIVGNSIARAFAFALQSLLSEDLPLADRETQKKVCSKVPNADGESCTLAFPVPPELKGVYPAEDAHISVAWRMALYRTDVFTDSCGGGTPEDCYRRFFRGESRPGDVLISNAGLAYIEYARGRGKWLGIESVPDIAADFERFLDSRVFNGTFIWSTVTLANPTRGSYTGFNPDMVTVTDGVAPLLQARRQPFIHMRSFMEGVTPEAAYMDGIHPRRQFYEALLYHAFAVVCGPGGVPRSPADLLGPVPGATAATGRQ